MKTITFPILVIIISLLSASGTLFGQKKMRADKYLESLPKHLKLEEKTPQKYLMTAEYFNSDIYGNFRSKIKVTGAYTRGLNNGHVRWNNVVISHSNNKSAPYTSSEQQDYMENMTYLPSTDILQESFFKNFSQNANNVFARNLIWDMYAIEGFAWDNFDSLQLNKTSFVENIKGAFEMADIGTYNHDNIELNWLGITTFNNKLCALIEYRSLNNKIALHTNYIKSKGSELYWGKTWISLENKQIEYAEMYSNTLQEIEFQGQTDKLLNSTRRILTVKRFN